MTARKTARWIHYPPATPRCHQPGRRRPAKGILKQPSCQFRPAASLIPDQRRQRWPDKPPPLHFRSNPYRSTKPGNHPRPRHSIQPNPLEQPEPDRHKALQPRLTPYSKPDRREPPPVSYLEATDFLGEECLAFCGRKINRRDLARRTDGRCRHCPAPAQSQC